MTIRALVYIPDRICFGICFPEFNIENKYPHVTLAVSQDWAPVMSNTILTSQCAANGAFHGIYEAARKGQVPAKNAGIEVARKVEVQGKGTIDEIVFVLLREPVTF